MILYLGNTNTQTKRGIFMIKDYFSFEGKTKKGSAIMSASHPDLSRRLEEMLKVAGKLLLRRTKRRK